MFSPRNTELRFNTQFIILLTFIESLKAFLIDMVAILVISVKLASLDLLKMKVFLNKGYEVIIFVNDVTNKILSLDSNHAVDVII